jgi:hypothetical protein
MACDGSRYGGGVLAGLSGRGPQRLDARNPEAGCNRGSGDACGGRSVGGEFPAAGFVATFGLLQYLLLPAGVAVGISIPWAGTTPRQRWAAVACALVLIASAASLIGRDYYGSLGW